MKNYIILFLFVAAAFSCQKEELRTDTNQNFWTPKLMVKKGNHEATLFLIDPRPFTEYFGAPPSNPDYFEIYTSSDNKSFSLYKRVDASAIQLTIDNLSNGNPYYFTVTTVKEGADSKFTDTLMTVPSAIEEPELLFADIRFSIERVTMSPDRKYIAFNSNAHPYHFGSNMLYYKSVASDSIKLLEGYANEASWSANDNMFVYLNSKLAGNTIFPYKVKVFDVENRTTTTLFEIDYSKYYVSSPVFKPGGEEISFLSSENSSSVYNYNVWTVSLTSRQKTKISDLESLGFRTEGPLTWSSNGEEIYLDGYYKSRNTVRNIYKLKISTGELTPVIESRWNDRVPSISPDNSKIAFSSDRTGKNELWIYNLNTKKYGQITGGSIYYFDSRYTNIQWLNNSEILLTLFKGLSSMAAKIKVDL